MLRDDVWKGDGDKTRTIDDEAEEHECGTIADPGRRRMRMMIAMAIEDDEDE